MRIQIASDLHDRLDLSEALRTEIERPPDRLPSRVAEDAAAGFREDYAKRIEAACAAGFDVARQEIMWMPKARLRYRPLTVLPLRERVVLRALVDDLAAEVSDLDAYRDTRQTFESDLLDDDPHLEYFVLADVASFYRYVPHGLLERRIVDSTGRADLAAATRTLLTLLMGEEIGLPQNVGPSDELADLFILPVERRLIRAGIATTRFNDDFRLGAASLTEAREALELLQTELHAIGLSVNDSKTIILRRSRFAKHVETQLVMEYVADTTDDQGVTTDQIAEAETLLHEAVKRRARRRSRIEEAQAQQQARMGLRTLTEGASAIGVRHGRAVINSFPSLTQHYARYAARVAGEDQAPAVLDYLEATLESLSLTRWQELWMLEPVIVAAEELGPNLGEWVDRLVADPSTTPPLRSRAALAAAQTGRIHEEQVANLIDFDSARGAT